MTTSPCIRVCRIERNACVGCGRTLDEIARWSRMSDDERAAVVESVAGRIKTGSSEKCDTKQVDDVPIHTNRQTGDKK